MLRTRVVAVYDGADKGSEPTLQGIAISVSPGEAAVLRHAIGMLSEAVVKAITGVDNPPLLLAVGSGINGALIEANYDPFTPNPGYLVPIGEQDLAAYTNYTSDDFGMNGKARTLTLMDHPASRTHAAKQAEVVSMLIADADSKDALIASLRAENDLLRKDLTAARKGGGGA